MIGKEKLYKSKNIANINIHPGGLKRLPDDYFYYFFKLLRGFYG